MNHRATSTTQLKGLLDIANLQKILDDKVELVRGASDGMDVPVCGDFAPHGAEHIGVGVGADGDDFLGSDGLDGSHQLGC